MARYSRARQISHLPNRYPGEWAFILCAKLASSAPAPAPVEQEEIREMGGEKREKREAEAQNHDGLHELLEKVEQGEISTGTHHLHASVTVSLGVCMIYFFIHPLRFLLDLYLGWNFGY